MSHWCARNRNTLFVLLAITLALGTFEGIFARTFLAADAVSYLDVAHLLRTGDWKTALNTLWGLGYPVLLALWLPLFPSNPLGEWIGVHSLNLVILVATFFSFYSLVAAAYGQIRGPEDIHDEQIFRWLILLAFPIFVTTEVYIDAVSRVNPDMLVSCLVFASVASLLRLVQYPGIRNAVLLGLQLGAGYIVKGIFLPLAIVFMLIVFGFLVRKAGGLRCWIVAVLAFAALALPYAAGMSWSFGHPTFGETGSLNYALRVNHLQGDVFWQGGPAGFGQPEHPAKQLMTNPTVFLFDWPANVTYGPWYDPAGYYYGYRHFFILRNQVRTISANLVQTLKLVRAQPVVYFLLFGLFLRRRNYPVWLGALRCLWPMLAVSFAGFGAYLLISFEPRYLASFISLLFLVFCVMLFTGDASSINAEVPPRARASLFALMLIACILDPIVRPRDLNLDPVANLRHHQFFWNAPEWLTAKYLAKSGVQPGERVAVVKGNFLCGWAYLAHLSIIGQVGGEWLNPRVDETGIFWHSSTEKQAQVLNALHSAGAKLVVGFEKPADVTVGRGWENVPGTNVWVFRQFQ
jgi:hypothetical protein